MKTLIQNLSLTNTTFNELLIVSNRNIGFFLKFSHGFSKQHHIFELWSLFGTLESLKSVKFLTHAVVLIQIIIQIPLQLQLHCSYSCIAVRLQLYIVKNVKFKEF